jgi:hypothetical protein
LKNYSGTDEALTYTLTVKTSAWQALMNAGYAPEDDEWLESTFSANKEFLESLGYTWETLVGFLGWNLVLS